LRHDLDNRWTRTVIYVSSGNVATRHGGVATRVQTLAGQTDNGLRQPERMVNEQTVIGYTTAAFCVVGLVKSSWLLQHSRHGQRLIRWFGADRAPYVLKLLLLLGCVFGILLGSDRIQPMRW